MKPDKNTLIIDILKKYPLSKDIFHKYNMGCISCMGVKTETLARGCEMHGVDVKEILKDIEQAIG